MIATNLKTIIAKTNKSQTAVAKALGIAPSRFSDLVNGRAFLDDDEFKNLCEKMNVRPEDVYDGSIIEIVYGEKPEKQKKTPASVQVRVSPQNIAFLDELVENGVYESRCEALNAIINAKRRSGNGWNDIETGDAD